MIFVSLSGMRSRNTRGFYHFNLQALILQITSHRATNDFPLDFTLSISIRIVCHKSLSKSNFIMAISMGG